MPTRSFLFAAILLATAACGPADDAARSDAGGAAPAGEAGAAAPASSGDDLADVTSYRLTMDKLDKFYAAQRNLALKAKAMSPEEREAMRRDDSDEASGSGSLDDLVRRIESVPQMRDAIRDAGLSPREYAVLTMSLLQSGMAASVIKMRPKDDPDSLAREMQANIENVRFVQEHEAELTRRQKALEAEMKAAGVEEES
jgi:hypothetical protein